jgi:DNA topoisomerase I
MEVITGTRLRYINDKEVPGIKRLKKGQGFSYQTAEGKSIKDKESLLRINSLAIPPAWTDVWISPLDNSHLQATGIDAKGRKQYLYHTTWKELQQQHKFDRMSQFGEMLPKIRRHVRSDMENLPLSRERVLATVVWLLEHTFIRVGNEEYAKENNSYGLTTMRVKHVSVSGEEVKFQFVGKSGVKHSLGINHPRVAKTIKKCLELPGYEIFQYLDDSGERQVVDSSDVNEYLQNITGEEITAKDFRTWGGTLLSAVYLIEIGPFNNKTQAEKNVVTAIKKVAKDLGNLPSTCRNYYVHPIIIESYQKGNLIPYFERVRNSENKPLGLTKDEYAVIELLNG